MLDYFTLMRREKIGHDIQEASSIDKALGIG